MKKDVIEKEGVIIYKNRSVYKVEIDDIPDHIVTAKKAGSLEHRNIQLLVGDRVNLEISIYDLTKGRITFRQTQSNNISDTYNQRRAKTVRQESKKLKKSKRRKDAK